MPFFFPSIKNTSGSSSCTPSSKANLFASTFTSNLDDKKSQPPLYPTSTVTMSPIKFSTSKVRKDLLQLNTSKSSGPDGIPAIVLKSCAPELAPVLNKLFSNFPTILAFSLPLGNSPTFSLSAKKVTNLTLQTIALLQSLPSSKTMETIIAKQLLAFLETNNLLSDHQYGFRQARSTGDLLAYALHAWSSALESYGESGDLS